MILGIGTDIADINEFEDTMNDSSAFCSRIFTEEEIIYCNSKVRPSQHYAGRFAAKEAVMKAFGKGWRQGISWKDIEIINNNEGMPEVYLKNNVGKLAEKNSVAKVWLSISHSGNYATAFVILEK